MHHKAIILDGDDTLWEIQVFYDEAKHQFYQLMERQGFDHALVQVVFAARDQANVARMGFTSQRFPTSMLETYEYFCNLNNQQIDTYVAQTAYEIGATVFERKPTPIDGVVPMLAALKQAYDLFLYSAGDIKIQAEKVRLVGLADYFQGIYLVEHKTVAQLQRILDERNLSKALTWMVGNSIRSDINPALHIGIHCIWVHTHSWDYDQELMMEGQVWEVSSVTEIPNLLGHIDNAPTSDILQGT